MTFLSAVTAVSAQITLGPSDYNLTTVSGTDTLLTSGTAALVNPPLLPGQASFNQDMSAYTSAANKSLVYKPTGPGNSSLSDSESLSFGSFLAYKANYEYSLFATAYQQKGILIARSALGLGTTSLLGALPTDSIVINAQDIVFSSNRTILAFPVNFKSSWTSNFNFNFNFTVTFAAANLNQAPGIVSSFVTEKDTVTGYGTIQVRTMDGGKSNYIPVLQVQSTVTTRDSFYLNGSLMSPTQLSLFSAGGSQFTRQGQTTVQNDVYYYRVGEFTPALHIAYDSTNTYPVSAESQASRMPEAVPEVSAATTLKVYPNPVTGHTIFVSGSPANYGNWNYELQNVAGQVMTKGVLQLSNNQSKVSVILSTQITPGTYFLHLYNNGTEAVRTLTIN